MIKWAKDVGHNIDIATCEKLRKTCMKFATCYSLKDDVQVEFNTKEASLIVEECIKQV